VPELVTDDATLHVEIDGEGSPVTVLAHGLTNSCQELALLTPLVPGTKIRFCFRGHGHSSSPERGYRFADFARDLDAVADAFGAQHACGTSLGAGAIGRLVSLDPDRFEKLVLVLPAGLDQPFQYRERMLRTAQAIDGKSLEDAIEAVMQDPERQASYERFPFLRQFDLQNLANLNTVGVPRAIREIIDDWPLRHRDDVRKVTAPTLIIGREGDAIHPAEVAYVLADLMPNAELLMFGDGMSMYEAIPEIVTRVREFLLA
jgi:pimeloyl-ACP methyl ester carboxylesterase